MDWENANSSFPQEISMSAAVGVLQCSLNSTLFRILFGYFTKITGVFTMIFPLVVRSAATLPLAPIINEALEPGIR